MSTWHYFQVESTRKGWKWRLPWIEMVPSLNQNMHQDALIHSSPYSWSLMCQELILIEISSRCMRNENWYMIRKVNVEATRSRKNVGMTRNGPIIVERVFRAHGGQPENSGALRRRIWLAVCGRCLLWTGNPWSTLLHNSDHAQIVNTCLPCYCLPSDEPFKIY